MQSAVTSLPRTQPLLGSKAALYAGRALSVLAIAFLTFDGVAKVLQLPEVIEGSAKVGFAPSTILPLGVVLLTCVLLYALPPTSIFGAVLLTGYLGGAVATHVRMGDPLFSHVLAPVYVAAFVWGGLFLRDRRVRALVAPGRARSEAATMTSTVISKVTSKDGTAIAYERTGDGPALILVDGALCSRQFGPSEKLAPLLAKHFTVITYDRRGRGDSEDRPGSTRDRELEDVAALIDVAGGSAFLVGLSSGGALALEAAASGLNVRKVVAYEPPYIAADGSKPADHQGQLRALLAAGKRGGAVKYFMRDMVGVPAPFVFIMQLMRGTWRKLQAVAHTLPYDAAVMGDWAVPSERLSKIRVPTIALYGGKTDARLKQATTAVAGAIPGATTQVLPGQNHNVKPEVLSQALVQLLAS